MAKRIAVGCTAAFTGLGSTTVGILPVMAKRIAVGCTAAFTGLGGIAVGIQPVVVTGFVFDQRDRMSRLLLLIGHPHLESARLSLARDGNHAGIHTHTVVIRNNLPDRVGVGGHIMHYVIERGKFQFFRSAGGNDHFVITIDLKCAPLITADITDEVRINVIHMLAVAVLQRILNHITIIGHTVVPMIPRITRPLLTPVVLMIRSRYFIQCNFLFGRSPVKRCPYEEIALLGFTRDGDRAFINTHAGGVTDHTPNSGFRHIGSNSAIVSGSSCFHCNLSDGGYIHFFLADSDPKVTALQCNILQFRIRILLSPCHGPDIRKGKPGECALLLHFYFSSGDRASISSVAYATTASFRAVKTGRHGSTIIIVLSQNAAVVIKRSIHRSHIIAGSDDTSVFSKADNAALVKS